MQKRLVILKTGDFRSKTKNFSSIPDNAVLVAENIEGLYPNIGHAVGLRARREALDKQDKNLFLQKICLRRQSLYWRTTLILTGKLNNKFVAQLSVSDLHDYVHVFS